jgi:hypothetical protein
MKNKIILSIVTAIIFTACRGRNDPETLEANRANAQSPEFVADTPKGKLFRINIDMGSTGSKDRIYYFDTNNETININRDVKHGKTSRVETTVIINGVEYIRK